MPRDGVAGRMMASFGGVAQPIYLLTPYCTVPPVPTKPPHRPIGFDRFDVLFDSIDFGPTGCGVPPL